MEWTHWKNASGTALRGVEWYVFDADSLRVPIAVSADDTLAYVADHQTGKVASYKKRK